METWTDEYLDLMVRKLTERKQRERGTDEGTADGKVSVETLAAGSHGMVEVVKK